MQRRQLSPAWIVCGILLVPLAVPVLFVLLGPSVDQAGAQDLMPKPTFLRAPKTSEEPKNSGSAPRRNMDHRSRAKNLVTASPQKPSGKMEFVPDSPAPRTNRPTPAARTAANAVVRRQVPDQPAKVAITSPTPQAAPRLKGRSGRDLPAPGPVPVADQPETQIASKELEIPEPKPVMAPEVVANSPPEPLPQISERPEPALPEFEASFELPIVQSPQRPMPTLEEDEPLQESPPAPAGHDVAELFFDENLAEDDADENMELVDREANEVMELAEPNQSAEDLPEAFAESTPVSEIQKVAVQEKPEDAKAAVASEEELQGPSNEVLAELRRNPINSIEIRKAVELPPLAAMEDQKLREPPDQALAFLRKRPPFRFWPVYREPWTASRDSFAFHHNPLWFEDPNLERCGRGLGFLTSGSSALQFCANIPILPYRMTAERYGSCVRTLPDCTVCQSFGHKAYLPPWSWQAAAVQGAAVTGFIYMIP